MRHGIRIAVLGAVFAAAAQPALTSAAWSQVGTVDSHQKISDLEGGFTATIDNLDELGGAAASLGDLDGAGPSVVALAVGCVGDDDGGGNRGAVYILFLDATGNVLSHSKLSDTAGSFTAVIDDLDDFGSSVTSLGDLDGAGPSVCAIAVGATGDDDGGSNRGCVYIIFLDAAGTCLSFQKISDTAGSFTAVIDNADEFGGAVAGLGDLDGGGGSAGALAVGCIGDDDGGLSRGCVYILFLSSAGVCQSFQKISDTSGNFTEVLADFDEIGSSVAALGDLDEGGPAVSALAMGAIGDDDGGSDKGAVYILYLSATGTILSHAKISATTGGFTGALDVLDEFGGALAAMGDLDDTGPSVQAMAVGTIGDDDGGSGRGATYVVLLNGAGGVLSHVKISDLAGNFTGALSDGDEFGGTLAWVGNLSGSANTGGGLVIGASFDDDGGEDRGAVWTCFIEGVPITTDAGEWAPGTPLHALGAARPNPFNPRTMIPFRIGAPGWVEIDIWDAQGRLVRRLVQGRKGVGAHQALWDGLDDRGRALASGPYFYRLSVDGAAASRAEKAILVK